MRRDENKTAVSEKKQNTIPLFIPPNTRMNGGRTKRKAWVGTHNVLAVSCPSKLMIRLNINSVLK